MTKCAQCNSEIKCIGGVENMQGVISLYVCFKPKCPNFCLAQVGLSEVENENQQK